MIASPAFPNLAEIMMQKRLSCHAISLRTGIEEHTVLKSLRGQRELKLLEAIAIKNVVGSNLPIEKLFQRKFNLCVSDSQRKGEYSKDATIRVPRYQIGP